MGWMNKIMKIARNKIFQYTVIILFLVYVLVGGVYGIIKEDKKIKENQEYMDMLDEEYDYGDIGLESKK